MLTRLDLLMKIDSMVFTILVQRKSLNSIINDALKQIRKNDYKHIKSGISNRLEPPEYDWIYRVRHNSDKAMYAVNISNYYQYLIIIY